MNEQETKALNERIRQAKNNHDLHVLLLMRKLKLSKSQAIVMAYLDGLQGLDARIEQGASPAAPTQK